MDKIAEIENRPVSEAEKAAKMEEVMQAVAGTTGTAEERFLRDAERLYEKALATRGEITGWRICLHTCSYRQHKKSITCSRTA